MTDHNNQMVEQAEDNIFTSISEKNLDIIVDKISLKSFALILYFGFILWSAAQEVAMPLI